VDFLHEGHRKRVRSRFLSEGLSNFQPHNALELLLFYSVPRRDTNELAHRLMENFGTLSGVLEADFEELLKIEGISENTATLLKLIPELAKYYQLDRQNKKDKLDTYDKIGKFMLPYFLGEKDEAVYLLCLDSKLNCIGCSCLRRGSVNSASINARLLANAALKVNAVSVVLAHNHPGGLAIPSAEDISTTYTLIETLKPLGICLLDHIIVADNDFVSLALSGFVEQNGA
jgi:DNA repair protein RadC